MIFAGEYTNSENKYIVNTYCPANATEVVDCIACEGGKISSGQGCNCAVDAPTSTCALSTADKCSKCLDGNLLTSDPKFLVSDGNCATCYSAAKQYTSYKEGFVFHISAENCQTSGSELKDYSKCNLWYCDLCAKHCKPCAPNCSMCISAEFCIVCRTTDNNNVLTIDGKCPKQCNNIQASEYCLDGVATDCAADATSECSYSSQLGCATLQCRQNWVCHLPKNFCDGSERKCTYCAEGHVHFAGQCIKPTTSESSNKLGGGTIAGIVISALVVVGGWMTYYFIRTVRK
uniref:Cysteine-rich membrane protein 2 n=1 Tax=Spironucleus salmonicida TaxID=348837 RepID=V6LQ40_9EUKA|eukprot:EST42879.1 Cysteine-rich membrane protein 2 [Spironucleus salmonicida]